MSCVSFHTLGCKVNYYETEALKGILWREGYLPAEKGSAADIYIFNTCCVTAEAERKSRQIIRRAKRENPRALVVVMGCYAQVNPRELQKHTGADLILGTANRLELPGLLKSKLSGKINAGPVMQLTIADTATSVEEVSAPVFEDLPWLPEQGRTRAFLKIQDGCSQHCSFCIIPLARGALRSLPLNRGRSYLEEIERAGYQEVVLTGIHLGLYGVDLQPPASLVSFLKLLPDYNGIKRVRLSSLEPADLSPDLIETMGREKVICAHLHIPLQSGDDHILKEMGRPYSTSFYASLLSRLRQTKKDLAVSSDIMVGFPGEREEHFQNSLDFVRECAFSRLHVFPYSPRPGTAAAKMPGQVQKKVKVERSRKMIALGEELAGSFQQAYLGREMAVLLEKEVERDSPANPDSEQMWEGFTTNYLPVRIPVVAGKNYQGQTKNIQLQKSYPGYLLGKEVEKS